MAEVACSSYTLLPKACVQTVSARPSRVETGTGGVCGAGWSGNRGRHVLPLVQTATRLQPFTVCRASEKGKLAEAKKFQLQATELLAELLKSNNIKATAQKYLDSLTEDFFMIASTYLELARKEGNAEVVNKIENALQIAMTEKGKTLRPEIRLMNELLNETSAQERAKTIQSNLLYLEPDGYFFELLQRMTNDVDLQPNNPKRQMLLAQLRTVTKETKEAAKAVRKGK